MSLELVKETAKVSRIIGKESAKTIVENDIIVPDVKPDIARILVLDGDVYISGSEAAQGRVLVNGSIRYKILYTADDQELSIRSINASSRFDYSLDMPDVKQGMKCRIKCDIEHIDYEILNGRKVNVKTVLNVEAKVSQELEQLIAYDLAGSENVRVLKDNFTMIRYTGSGGVDSTIRETMEVPAGKPAIREILRCDVKVSGKDYKIDENRIIAKGELNVSTLYLADDAAGSIQFMEHEVPFVQPVELPGISENAVCSVEYGILGTEYEAVENGDGELRSLRIETALNLSAEGFYKSETQVIADAYSLNARLILDKGRLKMEDIASENKEQVVLKEIINVGEESPAISEVFNVLCKPGLSGYKIAEDRVIIEGYVGGRILYLADNAEQPVTCVEREIPFKHAAAAKGLAPDASCDIGLDIEHSSYSIISPREVELRLVLGVTSRVVRQVEVPVIERIAESPMEERKSGVRPSIVIYFAQPGDNLWKIAKRYLTTTEEIIKLNNLAESDAISPGQQVIIPKRPAAR